MNHPAFSGHSHLSSPSDRSGSVNASSSSGRSDLAGASVSSGLSDLSGLSDRILLSRIKTLRQKERAITLALVLHLIEIERRRLFGELGYGSLFDYCIRHLKYSASAAGRRIQTARCIRRFPEVYDLLARGEVNLSTVSLIAPVLSAENKKTLLTGICHKSQCEVEMLVAGYRPPVAFRDRVRPVCVTVPRSSDTSSRPAACEESDYSRRRLSKNSFSGGECC